MERLTRRLADGRVCFKPNLYGRTNKEVCDRLAAYEDTGLEPEEVNVIAGLASENCAKAADKIDQLLSDDKELEQYHALGPIDHLRELKRADDEGRCVVLPCKIGSPVYSHARKLDGADYAQETEFWWSDIPEIGKTVFLTRGEAAAALRREQDEKGGSSE